MNYLRNINVILYLISNFFKFSGWSVWGYTLLSNIIYLSTSSNIKIGLIETSQGMLAAVLAIPFGILGDKWSKHKVGKIGLTVKLLSLIGLIVIMTHRTQDFYWFLFGSLSLYGISNGIDTASIATLYTNSIKTGDRSKWLMYLQLIQSSGLVAGPLVSILLLKFLHNNWALQDMTIPWCTAVGLSIIACVIQMFMLDKYCLSDEVMGTITKQAPTKHFGCLDTRHVPYLCAFTDLLFGLATGMTTKFYPLFFQQIVKYDPMELEILFALGFIILIPITYLAQIIGGKIGRVQACMMFPYLSLIFTSVIAAGKGYYWNSKIILGTMFALRLAVINANAPIHRSIIDDYVDSKNRSCWNSMEFIFTLGWSASALLGGLIVDNIGYQWLFIITLIIQFISTTTYWLLIPLVDREENYLIMDTREVDSIIQ